MGPRLRGDDTLRVCAASLALALLTCLIATDGFTAPLPSQLGPEVAMALSRLRRTRNTIAHEPIMLAAADAAAFAEASLWMIGQLTLRRRPHKIPAVPIL